jgi:hypothetical protein
MSREEELEDQLREVHRQEEYEKWRADHDRLEEIALGSDDNAVIARTLLRRRS